MHFLPRLLLPLLLISACSPRAEEFTVLTGSVQPATAIDWLGSPTKLTGEAGLKLNQPLPPLVLVNQKMKDEALANDGRVRLISVLPSLDTEVCDRQTHILSETKKLNATVERITVSRDLPYAQRRFAESGHLGNLTFFSDYHSGNFGKSLGLEVERNGLLARALIVVDKEGIVRHFQIVPSIYALPDLEKAIAVANELAAGS